MASTAILPVEPWEMKELPSQPTTPTSSSDEFSRETFSNGNGEEIVVEPLEKSIDGKDENCKSCQ
jgi:hypothetical protein